MAIPGGNLDSRGRGRTITRVPLFTIEHTFRYDAVRLIAEGGMGVVYEAEQWGAHGFRKRVALKVIRSQFASQRQFVENFIGEAKLVADLIHTNIVQTYHLGETNGEVFLTMELINGVNLEALQEQLRAKQRPLPVELAVFIVSRIARGLAYAHAKTDGLGRPLGLVHRDVSFKNVMIAFEGDVKLTDFGIAKARGFLHHEEGETVVGKPDYMSPEQADFRITDGRSDVFSAGVVLAHLLLGRNLFHAGTAEASRQRILSLTIPDFSREDGRVDARLNEIARRALERDVDKRYSAVEFLGALERYLYEPGFGPTNEKLGTYVRELFGQHVPRDLSQRGAGSTRVILQPPGTPFRP